MAYRRKKTKKTTATVTGVIKSNHRYIREKLCQLVKSTQVRVFKNDPISWIPKQHVIEYKREIAWHLYQITRLINVECWGIVVDFLFLQHSHTIFSLIYQLSNTYYCRSALPFLTSQSETYSVVKKVASIYNTNIILYKPNYIPQYLKVPAHYLKMIPCGNTKSKKTMLIYSQPIECLHSTDYDFQLGALTDLKNDEHVRPFFDMSKCLINFQDFDHCTEIIDEEHISMNTMIFRRKFDEYANSSIAKYKLFVSLWCESEGTTCFPDIWWPYLDNRIITIEQFVLLLIKVTTTYSGAGLIIYKSMYYCICGDIQQTDLNLCELHDDGDLTIPLGFSKNDLDTKYKRGQLVSLVNNFKHLKVH